jgi:hypothetical protein
MADHRLADRAARQAARALRRDSPANLPDYIKFFQTADKAQVRYLASLLRIPANDWVRWDDEKF